MSIFCDRVTTVKCIFELGFISFVVAPLYDTFRLVFPNMQMIVSLIKENKAIYQVIMDKMNGLRESRII